MIQQLRFNGLLNKDDRNELVIPGSHVDALNVRFYGTQQGLSCQNIPGNLIVDNAQLPGTGTNKPNGSFYDPVRKRVYWFNFNSGGLNGLYYLDMNTRLTTKVFLCGADSATDIFNLSLDYPVHSMAIVYRTTTDGDLLYWTDGLNRPRYLNVDTVSLLSPFTEDMINAAKNAPLIPISSVYADDSTRTSNNLRKQLFQFALRWKYKNLEYSTISTFSKLPLPANGYDPDTQNDPTLNNNIVLTFKTGGSDFDSVELLVRVNQGTSYGNWLSLITLGRADYSFSPDTNYTYKFYNDGIYPVAGGVYINQNPQEGELFFSYLPDYANTLESLNGNVIIYGGLTDGYDAITRANTSVVVGSGFGSSNTPSFSFSYSGTHEIICYVGPTVIAGTTYHLFFDYFTGSGGDASPKNINYVAILGDTQTSVVSALILLVNGNNIIGASLGGGYFRVVTTAGPTPSITNAVTTVSTSGSNIASATWKTSCQERLGIIYFDDRSKTNGVVYFPQDATIDTNVFDTNTPDFSVQSNVIQIPYLTGSINHTPPTWAVQYQWVRVPMTPKFLQWVTNDYQTDTNFLYFCIQNLTYTATKLNGYVPSYEFVKGDRIKVLASYNSGTGFFTSYNLQLDMEILGEEQKIMTTPAVNGRYIKVAKPTTFPSAPYSTYMLVELYTPFLRSSTTKQIFFEWGERYAIYESSGNRYHRGQLTDQTASQPATFQWFDGDIYFRNRNLFLNVGDSTALNKFMFDANYSDYFVSEVNSNGRGWAIEPNAAQTYRHTQSRWGQSYQQDTDINGLNIFYPNDFDTYDLGKGAIVRFKTRNRIMRVFQQNGVGEVGVYTKFIKDSGETTILESSDTIITTNNIQYYLGDVGLGNQPCSLVSHTNRDYFPYPVTGNFYRLSDDGLTNLSELYKGQFYFKNLIAAYNKDVVDPNGNKSFILGAYDYFDEQFVCVLQGGNATGNPLITGTNERGSSQTWNLAFRGTPQEGDVVTLVVTNGTNTQTFNYTCISGETTQTLSAALVALINLSANFTASTFTFILNYGLKIHCSIGIITVTTTIVYSRTANQYAFSFNESRNGFCSFYSFKTTEWIQSAEDKIITWSDGQIYINDNPTYNKFFDVQYDSSITVPFNQNLLEKKTWMALTQIGSDVFECPEITTNVMSYGTTPQSSKLIPQNFTTLEGNFHSSFLRDMNSTGGWINGSFLKGNIMVIKFLRQNAASLVYINMLSVVTKDSPLTVIK